MVPPLQLTGNPTADYIALGVGALVCLYWLRALRLARHGVRLFLRNLAIGFLLFLGCKFFLSKMHIQEGNTWILSFFAAVTTVLYRKSTTRRSRSIPASVRRAVIARDLKGEEYDPNKHHLDHVWPFSKGGSHTADNLRVIARRKNLQKGARRPRLREMW
jgi:hypothetical protein